METIKRHSMSLSQDLIPEPPKCRIQVHLTCLPHSIYSMCLYLLGLCWL